MLTSVQPAAPQAFGGGLGLVQVAFHHAVGLEQQLAPAVGLVELLARLDVQQLNGNS